MKKLSKKYTAMSKYAVGFSLFVVVALRPARMLVVFHIALKRSK